MMKFKYNWKDIKLYKVEIYYNFVNILGYLVV